MSKLIAVVIRQLPNARPVTSVVIEEREQQSDIDDVEHYLFSKAKEHIGLFTSQFVEFKEAVWYIDILSMGSSVMHSTTKVE